MARSTVWVYNPHRGGTSIPPLVRRQLEDRLRAHGRPFLDPLGYRLEVRFHGCFCYLDAADEQQGRDRAVAGGELLQLCRLRYRGDADRVSFAFHSYSVERYEPGVFSSGEWMGTPEEAPDVCAGTYLGAAGRGTF